MWNGYHSIDSLAFSRSSLRAVVRMYHLEGKSYEEISEITGVNLGTVKSRLARARLQMRSALQGYGDLLPAQYTVGLSQTACLL